MEKRLFLLFLSLLQILSSPGQIKWKKLEAGLRYGELMLSEKAALGNSILSILEINPAYFHFRLVSASENGGKRKSPEQWCQEKKLCAAINAGLFLPDPGPGKAPNLFSAGYMKNYRHVNQPAENNYSQWIAFNPSGAGLPDFRIADSGCEDIAAVKGNYQTLIQSNTLLDCKSRIVWQADRRRFSMALLGTDAVGRVLMMHCRSPYNPAVLAGMIRKAIPDLSGIVYLEGGLYAGMFIRTPGFRKRFIGSYQTTFSEHDKNRKFLPVPNVLGIERKY